MKVFTLATWEAALQSLQGLPPGCRKQPLRQAGAPPGRTPRRQKGLELWVLGVSRDK